MVHCDGTGRGRAGCGASGQRPQTQADDRHRAQGIPDGDKRCFRARPPWAGQKPGAGGRTLERRTAPACGARRVRGRGCCSRTVEVSWRRSRCWTGRRETAGCPGLPKERRVSDRASEGSPDAGASGESRGRSHPASAVGNRALRAAFLERAESIPGDSEEAHRQVDDRMVPPREEWGMPAATTGSPRQVKVLAATAG